MSGRILCQASAGAPVAVEPKKVPLGASPVTVTELGIGAWAWGDSFFWNDGSWTDIKMKGAKQAFETSMQSGLTFFDTAEVYGTKMFGGEDSEALLGRFIKETKSARKGEVVVATKFAALPYRLGRESVVKALKDSLRRLDMPAVDLYQLHWPGLWQNEAYIDGLADVVDQGLARAVGVSNYGEKRLRDAHAQLAKRGIPLASNQVHYSLLYRKPEENGVKAAADELGVTIIAYSPIAQGVLSGKYTPENPPTGPRGQIFSPEILRKTVPLIAKMREIGERYGGKTPTQVALNWLIAQGNTVPIPGAKSRQQADEFSGALGWTLTKEEIQELRDLAKGVPSVRGFPAENLN